MGKEDCAMGKRVLSVIVLLLFISLSPAYADQNAQEILKAIVKVRATVPKDARTAETLGTEREGNGVVIDSNGHILTIGYLVVEAETIQIIGPEEKSVSAAFVGYDHDTGFGLLRAEKPLDVAPLKLGKSSELKEGEPVMVAGYGGAEAAQAARVISRKEFAGYWEYLLENAIYTAPAYVNFGGAALIDREGQLLGIGSLLSQLVFPGVASIPCNVFVPIDLLDTILADLKTAGHSRKPQRPWLGINTEEAHGRIFITKVTAGGPAEKAGLKPGDIVLAVNKEVVSGLADFYRKVWALGKAGVEVRLSVLQGIQVQEVGVHSIDRHDFLQLKKPAKKI
jgi:S1-C subfamily serine protease